MTKTYELPNEKMIMADVDEKHHTATLSVYALDEIVEAVNKTGTWEEDILDKIRAEIEALEDKMLNLPNDWRTSEVFENVLDIIDKYKAESEE